MMRRSNPHARRLALVAVASVLTAWVVSLSPSSAEVTAVKGSASGYYLNIVLFNAQQPVIGPTPVVTLPPGGSATPLVQTATTGQAQAGPAQFFSSGPITVRTEGSPATGSVTSSVNIERINTSGDESFTADSLQATCTATQSGVNGSVNVVNGRVLTDTGDDQNNTIPDHAPTEVPVPNLPGPNTRIPGHIHVNGTTDNFEYIFNEQIQNADGSLTINAVHQRALGPSAVGDLIIGQVVCGVTATQSSTTSSVASTSTSTSTPASTSTSTPASTSTSTPASTTSTTVVNTTTSTTPSTTTTSVPGLPPFITQIICGILRSLQSIDFIGPFITPLLTVFRCGVG